MDQYFDFGEKLSSYLGFTFVYDPEAMVSWVGSNEKPSRVFMKIEKMFPAELWTHFHLVLDYSLPHISVMPSSYEIMSSFLEHPEPKPEPRCSIIDVINLRHKLGHILIRDEIQDGIYTMYGSQGSTSQVPLSDVPAMSKM